jgi:hypothetical protein
MLQLEKLQSLLRRLDPTQPIHSPVQQSWYVPLPSGLSKTVARSIQLEPTGSHLIVGAIGCGKSTELLAIGRKLLESRDVFCRYIEVSRVLDLEQADSISLVIAIAHELVEYLVDSDRNHPSLRQIQSELRPLVEGGHDPYWDAPDGEDPSFSPPIVNRPRKNIPDDLAAHIPILEQLVAAVDDLYHSPMVWLLDGLDRLSNSLDFDKIVEPFLRALKEAGVGLVMVGPRKSILGVDRLGASGEFDDIKWMGPVDPDVYGEFLNQILVARGAYEILPKDCQDELVRYSGGSIRMLLQLTQEVVREVWIRNVDGPDHDIITSAVDKIGRSLLLGLSDRDLQLLNSLLESGKFASRTAEDAALILTNRVLEYYDGGSGLPRHIVHPALKPYIVALPKPEYPY